MSDASSRSLFRQLLGSTADRETSVSKAFAACFRESPIFREAVLDLLWQTCGIRSRRPICDWVCRTEVTIDPTSRPDFHVQPADGIRGPLFRIESKVAAPLRSDQLRRYQRRANGLHLIAITKRSPEVGAAWMRRNGVFALRWQDVHRALSIVRARASDGYLCQSFNLYLEELGMAHREDIRAEDLKRIAKLFERVTATRNMGLGAEDAFRLAADCLAQLDDVMVAARDEEPKLRRFSKWGPNYYKFDAGTTRPQHCLFFHLHTGTRKWHTSCGAGFVFREDGSIPIWQVSGKIRGHSEREFNKPVGSVSRKDGVLDKEKMLDSFLKAAGRLGVV